jgi:HPt (histidine-containing phosphotransfer) domain-containing protein
MTVQECYEAMNGDYEGVKGRLLTDERIQKYLTKFLNSIDFQQLLDSLKSEDYEVAFRMAHNLKGVGLNLGLSELQQNSSVLCEALRGGKPQVDISDMLEAVQQSYDKTVGAIKQL